MIRKPDAAWGRDDDRLVETARQFGGAASKTLSTAASGVVRVRAAYSAAVCAFTAVLSGWAGIGAGLMGRNLPMAVLAGCFSLALGWLAMWNFRRAFGRSHSSRPLDGSRAAGPAAGWASQDGHTMPSGDGATICYNRTKLFLLAAGLFLVCVFIAAMLMRATHSNPVFSLIVLAALGFCVWRIFGLLLKAIDQDLTAISWNNRQIRVRTLTASCQVPWAALEGVTVKRQTTRMLGLIPISTSHTLMFRVRVNGSARKMNVPASVLAIRGRDAVDVMRRIELRRALSARNPMASGDQRIAEIQQTVAPSFRGAPSFEAYDSGTVAPAAFGRKVG